jgi:hypothetical protein
LSLRKGDVYDCEKKCFVKNYALKPPAHYKSDCKSVMSRWYAEQNANRKVFNYCVFCGDPDNVKHWKIEDLPLDLTHYDFCSVGPCLRYFREHYRSDYRNMEHGIPVVYDREFPDMRREVDRRRVKKNGSLVDLSCAYCGKKNSSVTTNGALVDKEKYLHADFCRNSECCDSYMDFVEDGYEVPHAFRRRSYVHRDVY